MDNILCLQFNNLYNKKVKRFETYGQYALNSTNYKFIQLNNFLPGDGIHTSDNWNWDEEWFPNYIVRIPDEEILYDWSCFQDDTTFELINTRVDSEDIETYTMENCPYLVWHKSSLDIETWTGFFKEKYKINAGTNITLKINNLGKAKDFYLKLHNVAFNTFVDVHTSEGTIRVLDGQLSGGEYSINQSLLGVSQNADINYVEISFSPWLTNPQEILYTIDSIRDWDIPNITDRWYVVQTERNRQGQYNFQFYRDLIADNLDYVKDLTAFVERGYVDNNSNLIFNKEGFSFNQVKKQEIPLMDQTQTPWIVGYIPFDLKEKTGNYEIQDDVVWTYPGNSGDWDLLGDKELVTDILQWQFKICAQENDNANRGIKSWIGYDFNTSQSFNTANQGDGSIFAPGASFYDSILMTRYSYYNTLRNANKSGVFTENTLLSKLNEYFGSISQDSLNNLLQLNGQIVRFDDGVFRLKVTNIQNKNAQLYTSVGYTDNTFTEYVGNRFFDWMESVLGFEGGFQSRAKLRGEFYYNSRSVTVSLEPVLESEYTQSYIWTLSGAGRRLKDNPYRMFAIPLSGVKFNFSGDIYNTSELENLEAAINISNTLVSSQEIYDLQLLPYCPVKGIYRNSNNELVIPSYLTEKRDYSWITYGTEETNTKKSVILYPSESTFTFQIEQPLTLGNIKIENETDLYRLCSPNYSAAFDFNLAMNRGVRYWNVYCTYKPYSPYIQVAPAFSGLYGDNFNDFRGLVCSGDFSLPLTDDAWTTYELNNKNYQNMFDRQISNLETMNKLALKQAEWQAGLGALTAGVQGATMGVMATGNPAGALFGVATGALSGIGGAIDVDILKQQQAETLDYTKDVYLMQLQNIQALPTTLSRITSLNANNKFYPFIEYYTCTDVEKEVFENYLKYNGMTVNAIGTVNDYLNPDDETFIKAQVIRIGDNIDIDYHELVEIAKLLKEGVYI